MINEKKTRDFSFKVSETLRNDIVEFTEEKGLGSDSEAARFCIELVMQLHKEKKLDRLIMKMAVSR